MPEAIIFADAHASADDAAGASRLLSFLSAECARAKRVFILGDLFDFWFGPRQARYAPYSAVLSAIHALSRGGTEVSFFHGNRDFYVDERLAREYGFRVIDDYSMESISGRRVLLCHGDMLCSNDVRYHRMRRLVRRPLTRRVAMALPAGTGEFVARAFRWYSRHATAAKSPWVLGINDDAVIEHFAKGADTIVCGHVHQQAVRAFSTPHGEKTLYTLGAFGRDGSYIACEADGFHFMQAGDMGA
jgi:UDP-2,3-diacylglucosamine hydrolase